MIFSFVEKIVCYLGSWSAYRNDEGNFQIEDINVTLCTHLIYAFVGLDGDAVAILDKWLDLADHGGKDGFKRFNALRQQNPNVKTLVAIGGWNEGSIKYSQMAANWTARGIFVKNVVDFVKKYEFDGFDVDWEYPTQRYGSPADRSNYVTLLEELSNAFTINNLLLSAAVGAPESLASEAYNIHEISKYLDFINLMTYDFHGPSEKQTGHNTPLYASSTVDKKATVVSINFKKYYKFYNMFTVRDCIKLKYLVLKIEFRNERRVHSQPKVSFVQNFSNSCITKL